MAKRLFTVQEAESILPAVEADLRQAVSIKPQYADAEAELNAVAQRVTMSGGALVNREQLIHVRGRRDALAARLKELIDAIQEFGCLVKDLDNGLLDFPTLFRDEEVYLCWKLGEPGIVYWHRIQDGFRGRQRIDADFLANHRGEPPN